VAADTSAGAPPEPAQAAGDAMAAGPEAAWPGNLEFGLIFLLTPAIWMAGVVSLLVRWLDGSMNLIVVFSSGMVATLWLGYCVKRYRTEARKRRRYMYGLVYATTTRWSAMGLLMVAALPAYFLFRPHPTSGVDVVIKQVPKSEVDAKRKELDATPYKDDDQTRITRGYLALLIDLLSAMPAPGSGGTVAVPGPTPGAHGPTTTTTTPSTRPSGPTDIYIYIPQGAGETKRTEILRKREGSGFSPGFMLLGPVGLPVAAMANVLGIGGSTEYRQATLETMSQALDGGKLDDQSRNKMAAELAKLSPDQIKAWSVAAKNAIANADVDGKAKSAAEKVIDDLADRATKQVADLEKNATPIAGAILEAANKGNLDAKSIENLFTTRSPNPSPELRAKVREQLQPKPEWEAKVKAAWEAYEKQAAQVTS
jgi:hypothetical protein